jgi:hypothetical protein
MNINLKMSVKIFSENLRFEIEAGNLTILSFVVKNSTDCSLDVQQVSNDDTFMHLNIIN